MPGKSSFWRNWSTLTPAHPTSAPAGDFLERCDSQDIRLTAIRPTHVAQWRDLLLKTHSPTTVKQHMSAVKRLFDWLQLRDIINSNPVQPVRPPRLTRRKARSPALKPAEVVRLFDAIDDETVTDLRDRAALAIMTFNLARVSAVAHLRVDDVDLEDTEPTIRLLEKTRPGARPATQSRRRQLDQQLSRRSRHRRAARFTALPEPGQREADRVM